MINLWVLIKILFSAAELPTVYAVYKLIMCIIFERFF